MIIMEHPQSLNRHTYIIAIVILILYSRKHDRGMQNKKKLVLL